MIAPNTSKPTVSSVDTPTSFPETTLKDHLTENDDISDLEMDGSSIDMSQQMRFLNSTKRTHSPDEEIEITSESSSSGATLGRDKKRVKKKGKEEQALATVINNMTFRDTYLNADNFKLFMEGVRGKANARSLASQYTQNFGSLIVQLNEAENLCMDRNLRRRFKRVADGLLESVHDND